MKKLQDIVASMLDVLAYGLAQRAARMRGTPDQLGPIWRPKDPPPQR